MEDAYAVEGYHHHGDAIVAEGNGARPKPVVYALGGAVVAKARYPDEIKGPVAVLIGVGVALLGFELAIVIGIHPGVVGIHQWRDVAPGHAHLQRI